MGAIPSKRDNPSGLHRRYHVTKVDGEPVDPMATYFVLRLDNFGRDGQHIAACREAARAYARYVLSSEDDACDHLRRIVQDLLAVLENFEKFDEYLLLADRIADRLELRPRQSDGELAKSLGVDKRAVSAVCNINSGRFRRVAVRGTDNVWELANELGTAEGC